MLLSLLRSNIYIPFLRTKGKVHAVSEDRTRDLRIMGPTRCQLRYHRLRANQESSNRSIENSLANLSRRFFGEHSTSHWACGTFRKKPRNLCPQNKKRGLRTRNKKSTIPTLASSCRLPDFSPKSASGSSRWSVGLVATSPTSPAAHV